MARFFKAVVTEGKATGKVVLRSSEKGEYTHFWFIVVTSEMKPKLPGWGVASMVVGDLGTTGFSSSKAKADKAGQSECGRYMKEANKYGFAVKSVTVPIQELTKEEFQALKKK